MKIEQLWNGKIIQIDLKKLPKSLRRQVISKPFVKVLPNGKKKLVKPKENL